MRTTVDIEDEIFSLLKSIAKDRKQSMGKVIAMLVKKALRNDDLRTEKNGVPILKPKDGIPPNLELINRIRDSIE